MSFVMGCFIIFQGEDKKAIVKLRLPNGDPLDLTGVTSLEAQFIKKNRAVLNINLTQIPATKATYTTQGITFVAEMSGLIGNDIILNFDGVHTLQYVVDEWNSANMGNTVLFSGGDGTLVLTATTVHLANGTAAYFPVEIIDVKLGILTLTLLSNETTSLRLGEDQSITFIIDYGDHPAGIRKIAKLEKRLDVLKSSAL